MGITRMVLALSVVAAHCGAIFGLAFVGGQIAVQSFFIISGFYMSLILHEKYTGVNDSYKLFITNRFIRIYPVYWILLLLTVIACVGMALVTRGHSMPKFINYFSVKPNIFSFGYLALTNIIIFGQGLVMFLGIHPDNGQLFFTGQFANSNPPLYLFLFIPQGWTLGFELMFYLIAPGILKKGLKIVATLIIISLLLRLFIYYYLGLANDPWTFRFFPTELIFFLSGYISYALYLKIKTKSISQQNSLFVLFFLLAFTTLYAYLPDLKIRYLPFSIKEICYFSSITVSTPVLFNFFKHNNLDNFIGELSYPVYISHFLVSMVCYTLPFKLLANGSAVALMTIIFSYFLNRFIVSPIEKYRQARLKTTFIN